MPKIGGKKMIYMIGKETLQGYGRDKFFEILRDNHLLNKRIRGKRRPCTNSQGTELISPNIKKTTIIEHSNQLLESDITGIKIRKRYQPLFITMDVYSRKILGWNLCKRWTAEEAGETIKYATAQKPEKFIGSIHHSDRGVQYGSKLYTSITNKLGMISSMSRKATPTDEAHIERLNRTLKREFDLGRDFSSFEEAWEAVNMSVLIYNEIRPHWSLNLKTPSEVYSELEK